MKKLFKSRGQSGLASFMVTGLLVSLLGITAIAFAIVMNRESQKSVNNQIGQAAYDAAQSGINDAISYLRDNPDTQAAQCNDLLGAGKAFSKAANLSGDSSTQYTCVLINTTPTDLVYQSLPAYQSQVVKASTSVLMSRMMVSWQANNRNNNAYLPVGVAGSADNLLDETTWSSNRYAPMLKVSLYPVPASTKSLSGVDSAARTYYLYPVQASGSSVGTINFATAANASLQQVDCGVTNPGTFAGSADYDCNLIISNLPNADAAGYIYYVHLTPIYGTADVKIRGNDGSNQALKFINTQAIVDVTAQSSSAVKRLQARVDTSGLTAASQNITPGSDGSADYALRTTNDICKRIQLPPFPTAPAYIGVDAINNCYTDFRPVKLNPPDVSLNSPSYGGGGSITLSGSTDSNGVAYTECYFRITGSDGYSSQKNCSPYPGAGSASLNMAFDGLAAFSTSYTAQLCAANVSGPTCDTKTFSAPPPPPPPVDCNDYSVGWSSFGVAGNTVSYSVQVQGSNTCGLVFYQCNLLNSGGDNIAQISGNYSTSWTNSVTGAGYDQTAYMSCQTQDGKIWYSNVIPPPPVNVTAWITARSINGSDIRCNDGIHKYVVCVGWSSSQSGGSIDYCYFTNNAGNPYGGLPPSGNGYSYTFGYNTLSQANSDSIVVHCHSATYGNQGTSNGINWNG